MWRSVCPLGGCSKDSRGCVSIPSFSGYFIRWPTDLLPLHWGFTGLDDSFDTGEPLYTPVRWSAPGEPLVLMSCHKRTLRQYNHKPLFASGSRGF